MDRPARLFLCALCRVQVVLCSHCDRGDRYCSRACWRQVHDVARREAARRYQCSRRGRIAHAARSRRWRQRRAVGDDGDGDGDGGDHSGGGAHNVTHQGCHPGVDAAPLAAWTHDTASSSLVDIAAVPEPQQATAPATPWHCYRCAAPQPAWVRQGFLRHSARATTVSMVPTGRHHDHSP